MSDPHSAYVQWFIRADGEEARSPHCAYEAGWHARDEETLSLRNSAAAFEGVVRDLEGELERERARAEAAELRVRGYKEEIIPERNRLVTALACYTSGYDGGALARWALGLGADPAPSEAMREAERADGGGEGATGEDRPASRFAPGTRLIWYPRSRSRPHYDERVPAVVARDDGDGPWLMVHVRTKAGREHDRWVERGELSLEPTDETHGE